MNKNNEHKDELNEVRIHKHPFIVPVITIIFLSFATMIASVMLGSQPINPADSHTVKLSYDGKKLTIPTRAEKVGELLEKTNVVLREGDIVEPGVETLIQENDFRVNVYRARPVTIIDGDKRMQAFSAATTPRSVAEQVGIEVYPEDILKQEVSTQILKDKILGEKIVIDRAVPVNLNLYGTPVTVRTHAKTIKDLLNEKKLTLTEGDSVSPAEDTIISDNIVVLVTRFGTEITTVEEPIPMEVETIEDPSLSFGTIVERQKGSNGKKLATYQLELENGVEKARKLIQEVRVQEPVKQIVARGKAISIPSDHSVIMRAAGISPSDFPYVEFIINHENGLWCPTRWQGQSTCPPYYVEKFPGAETHKSTGYGLCQSTPAIKMATAGDDWRTNAVTQMKWCHNYAMGRYKSWQAAYNYWQANRNW